jgi:class 3 adenylate cyclase/tetratricopeptide (TPR) repeat protein
VDIGSWLEELGLGRYVEAFLENAIDEDVLAVLSEQDLASMGVLLGHRKKLLKAIDSLSKDESAAVESLADLTTPAQDGERRQVSVLFADLSSFTELSGELGAEATHDLLNRYFEVVDEIIDRYGGTIDKHIGDNVMAVFGAPIAHTDDPERAVRAALDIHEAIQELSCETGRDLQVHVGIASGQVVASGTGSGVHREYTVTGQSVNLASRLQEKAAPGETLISDIVYRSVLQRVDCAGLGELEVKGFAAPISVWRTIRLRKGTASKHQSPFMGRRREKRQFTGLVEECLETGLGQAVLVRGEAGIGKTRLTEEFAVISEKRGFACHRGLVLDFGAGKGQDAIHTLVRRLLGIPMGSGKSRRRDAAATAAGEGMIEADQLVILNDLLDLPQPAELRTIYDAMDNETRNAGKRAVVAKLVEMSSGRRPLLVMVEDIHWADGVTLVQLAGIATTVADCRGILVMTSRVEGDPLDQAWRASLRGRPLTTIDLGPLRDFEAEEFAKQFVNASSPFIDSCVQRAEGNPLFLEQLLRNAEEGTQDEVPHTIQSLVLARMDRLAAEDKMALQAASVIGQRYSMELLRHLMGNPGYECTQLIQQYLVIPDGDIHLFAHALIQEGVYVSLLEARRRELHRSAAAWFAEQDPVLRAQHLDRANDAEASSAYADAAQICAAKFEFDTGRQMAERGLEIAQETEIKLELACLLGDYLRDLGQLNNSISAFRSALDFATCAAHKCRVWIGLSASLRQAERFEEALAILYQAETAASESEFPEALTKIYYHRSGLAFRMGDRDVCLESAQRALENAERTTSQEDEARALSALGTAYYMRGHMITAHDHFHRCIHLCRENGFGRFEVANLQMRGLTLYFQSDLRTALREAESAAGTAVKFGYPQVEMTARGIVGGILFDLGELTESEEQINMALELARRLGARSYEPFSYVLLGKIRFAEGDCSAAANLIKAAVEISSEVGMKTAGPRALGALALITEDASARRSALKIGEKALSEGCISHHYFSFYRDAMDACTRAGDWPGVTRYADALEDYTRQEPLPLSDLFIARGRALAAFGRGRRDQEMARELQHLRDEAKRIGLESALPVLDEALATISNSPMSPGRG